MIEGGTRDALIEAARHALTFWGVRDGQPELLKYRENAVFRVAMPDGPSAVLRIHRPDYHSDAALRSELQFMAALNERGIDTPRPIPATDGLLIRPVETRLGPRQVDCLTWLPGRTLGTVGVPLDLPSTAKVRLFAEFGRTIARMHTATNAWQPPDDFERPSWDLDAFFGSEPRWGAIGASPWIDAATLRQLLRARDRAATLLAAHERSSRNYGLIHADLIRDNILVDGERIQVIDFDDSGYGWHMYDVAVALYHSRVEPDFPAVQEALIGGYRSVRPLPEPDAAALPLFTAIRALAVIGWWGSRPESQATPEVARTISTRAAAMALDCMGTVGGASGVAQHAALLRTPAQH